MSLQCSQKSLIVTWSDTDTTSLFPWIWLRDHAHDAETMHPITQQRQLFTAALAEDLGAVKVSAANDTLTITWRTDDAPSQLPVSFLARFRDPGSTVDTRSDAITLWDSSTIDNAIPSVEFETVMSTDDGVAQWLAQVCEFGFCLVLNTPATKTDSARNNLRRVLGLYG
jgi:trimethyllysine dioxygenase